MSRELAERRLLLPSDLATYVGGAFVGVDLTDKNGHLNNARYLDLYQTERDLYIEARGISPDGRSERFGGLRSFVVDFQGRYIRQVFPGRAVVIHTRAKDAGSHIIFNQDMFCEGVNVAYYDCTVWMANQKGMPTRMPREIRDLVTNAKFLSSY